MNFKLLTMTLLLILASSTFAAKANARTSATAATSAGFPTGAPYYFHTWTYGGNPNCETLAKCPSAHALPILLSNGFTENELMKWAPFIVSTHCNSGTDDVARGCKDKVNIQQMDDLKDLKSWINSGITPENAITYRRNNISLQGAIKMDPLMKQQCQGPPKDVFDADITQVNPYATKGKCYFIGGTVIQVADAHTALVQADPGPQSNSQALVLLTYSSGYVPPEGRTIYILAKSDGIFKYQTIAGNANIVPNLVTLYALGPEDIQ
ncbi:MAG: hypothetical protein ACRDHZ_21580 [Ktedonobacteraceae bacterium]